MHALIPGSFDPVTVGHLDIIRRAAALFSSVTVAVCDNVEKRFMFSAEERLRFLKQAVAPLSNVTAIIAEGWAADATRRHGADLIVKGLRGGVDFEYENQIAQANKTVCGLETLFLPSSPQHSAVCSAAVREMIRCGKDFSLYVPEGVTIF